MIFVKLKKVYILLRFFFFMIGVVIKDIVKKGGKGVLIF